MFISVTADEIKQTSNFEIGEFVQSSSTAIISSAIISAGMRCLSIIYFLLFLSPDAGFK